MQLDLPLMYRQAVFAGYKLEYRDFRRWHEPDLPRCPQFGRYRGESGHGGYERRLPTLTQLRHRRFDR